MSDYPISTYKAGELVADIETLLQKQFSPKTIEEKFPKRLILNEINRSISELKGLTGNKNDADYSDKFTITTESSSINMAVLDFEKIDKITAITYGSGKPCIEKDEKEYYNILSYGSNSNYKNEVIWHRKGTVIYFLKGSGIAAYGIRDVWFTRLPEKAIRFSDYLDVKDTELNLIKNNVISSLIGNPNSQAELSKLQTANAQSIAEVKKHGTED